MVITKDTAFEAKPISDTSVYKLIEPEDAVLIYIDYDTSNSKFNKTLEAIQSLNQKQYCHLEFYAGTNIMKSKISFYKDEKNGKWYYWDENGMLVKTEEWLSGRLIKSVKYKSIAVK